MTTTTPPTRPAADGPDDAATSGFAARLPGTRVRPVSSEFLLVASTALLLTGFGLMMVLSATMASAAGQSPFEVVMKQAIFAVIGIPLMFIASRLPVAFWKRIAWPALIAATCFQMLVFVPGLGVANDGNQNWIQIGGIQAQPSEFLKLALALWLGYVLFRKQTLLGSWAHVFIPVVPVGGLVIGLVAVGSEDLGTGMILMAILLGCLFFSGVKLRIFIIPLIVVVVSAVFFAVTNSNRMARIMSSFVNFDSMDCYNAAVGDCYQAVHGVWALANGGLFGLGLGNSARSTAGCRRGRTTTSSRSSVRARTRRLRRGAPAVHGVRDRRLPDHPQDPRPLHPHRHGRHHRLDRRAGPRQHRVVLRLLPVLGVPLPFMSQGGTSLLSVLFACGVLLSFARTIPVGPPRPRSPPGRSRRR
jgi:cell division protein FtsW